MGPMLLLDRFLRPEVGESGTGGVLLFSLSSSSPANRGAQSSTGPIRRVVAANIISAKFFPDVLIPKPNKLHHRAGISVGADFYQPIFVEGGWCIDNPPKIEVGSTVSVLFTVQGAGSIESHNRVGVFTISRLNRNVLHDF